jgi:uncharacterized protein (TIGR02466 family)
MFMQNLSGLEFTELFPSPLIKYLWPESDDLNKELSQLIRSKELEDRGVAITNVGGWHSKKNFQDWDGECVRTIISRVLILCQEMLRRTLAPANSELFSSWTVQAWANINRSGHYNNFHTHVNGLGKRVQNLNLWSGVYYVSMGREANNVDHASRIIFADQNRIEPRGRKEFRKRFFIQPEPGLMLLFPSSLGHSVKPHRGTGDRITIAFDLRSNKFTTVKYEMERRLAAKMKPA